MKEYRMVNSKEKKVEQLIIFLSLISNLFIYDFFPQRAIILLFSA